MSLKQYTHKIKTLTELCDTLHPFPREHSVVLCHGVFDVVHPGHVRHLLHAKSKASVLVASLTADRYVTKGNYRPHIPEALRAAHLAAFEMVDYVLIDQYATPLNTITRLQPDLFAKGFEYVSSGLHPKTAEEEQALTAYGGRMLFTPGDVVYSSTALLHMSEPDLRYEKLATLLDYYKISFSEIERSLDAIHGMHVHVVGDSIVDGFLYTSMIGGQTKTPTLSVRHESQINYLGGAAIVAQHLKAAGAHVTLTTLLGQDPRQKFILEELSKSGVRVNAVIDENRPTTYKNAVIAEGHRLLKIDTLDNSSINDRCLLQFEKAIKKTSCDIVICSDFRHGIFNRRTIDRLLKAIPEQAFKVADSQVASRWGNITEFKHFDLITPNEREARFALADQDSGIILLANQLYATAHCKKMILKLGEKGLLACYAPEGSEETPFFVPNFVAHVVDSVGAGDALLAYATLVLAKTDNLVLASLLGIVAAACECEREGNYPISPEHIREKLKSIQPHLNLFEEISVQVVEDPHPA